MFDLLIRNGQLVTGQTKSVESGDVAVADGVIVGLGPHLPATAFRVIEAEGRCVCPGFIDMHSHSDLVLLRNSRADWKLRQGVTTEVIGNCGFSLFPVRPEYRNEAFDFLAALFAGLAPDDLCSGAAEYLRRINTPNVNIAPLAGHNMLRICVNGSGAEISSRQIEAMADLLEDQLAQGAMGMSTGLLYPPASFARKDELLTLAGRIAKCNKIMAWHMRDEGDGITAALDEVLEVARRSGVSAQISHLKVSGRRNHDRMPLILERIERNIAEGGDISFDAYPYIFGNTTILSLLPPWALNDKLPVVCDKLRQPVFRARVKTDLRKPESIFSGVGPENIMVAACSEKRNAALAGLNLAEAAARQKTDVLDFVLDLIVQEKGQTSIFLFQADENDLRLALAGKRGFLGSDGIPLPNGLSHPRLTNAFLRFLGHYVAREKICSLPEAIAKMSALPAHKLKLPQRGSLVVGNAADISVFDLEQIKVQSQEGCHEQWRGVDYVILNGKVVVEETVYTGLCAGRHLS